MSSRLLLPLLLGPLLCSALEANRKVHENWIGDLVADGFDAAGYMLTDFTIPGSHDSGTYAVDVDCLQIQRAISGDGVARDDSDADARSRRFEWAKTQSLTITEQLELGIRYFEFKAMKDGLPDNDWKVYSTKDGFCASSTANTGGFSLLSMLGEIDTFIGSHTGEFAVVRIHQLRAVATTWAATLQSEFQTLLSGSVTNLHPTGGQTTLDSTSVADVQGKIILTVEWDPVSPPPVDANIWPASAFDVKTTRKQFVGRPVDGFGEANGLVHEAIKDAFKYNQPTKLSILPWAFSYDASLYAPDKKGAQNRKQLALPAAFALDWVLRTDEMSNLFLGNIITMDYVKETALVDWVIQMNKRECKNQQDVKRTGSSIPGLSSCVAYDYDGWCNTLPQGGGPIPGVPNSKVCESNYEQKWGIFKGPTLSRRGCDDIETDITICPTGDCPIADLCPITCNATCALQPPDAGALEAGDDCGADFQCAGTLSCKRRTSDKKAWDGTNICAATAFVTDPPETPAPTNPPIEPDPDRYSENYVAVEVARSFVASIMHEPITIEWATEQQEAGMSDVMGLATSFLPIVWPLLLGFIMFILMFLMMIFYSCDRCCKNCCCGGTDGSKSLGFSRNKRFIPAICLVSFCVALVVGSFVSYLANESVQKELHGSPAADGEPAVLGVGGVFYDLFDNIFALVDPAKETAAEIVEDTNTIADDGIDTLESAMTQVDTGLESLLTSVQDLGNDYDEATQVVPAQPPAGVRNFTFACSYCQGFGVIATATEEGVDGSSSDVVSQMQEAVDFLNGTVKSGDLEAQLMETLDNFDAVKDGLAPFNTSIANLDDTLKSVEDFRYIAFWMVTTGPGILIAILAGFGLLFRSRGRILLHIMVYVTYLVSIFAWLLFGLLMMVATIWSDVCILWDDGEKMGLNNFLVSVSDLSGGDEASDSSAALFNRHLLGADPACDPALNPGCDSTDAPGTDPVTDNGGVTDNGEDDGEGEGEGDSEDGGLAPTNMGAMGDMIDICLEDSSLADAWNLTDSLDSMNFFENREADGGSNSTDDDQSIDEQLNFPELDSTQNAVAELDEGTFYGEVNDLLYGLKRSMFQKAEPGELSDKNTFLLAQVIQQSSNFTYIDRSIKLGYDDLSSFNSDDPDPQWFDFEPPLILGCPPPMRTKNFTEEDPLLNVTDPPRLGFQGVGMEHCLNWYLDQGSITRSTPQTTSPWIDREDLFDCPTTGTVDLALPLPATPGGVTSADATIQGFIDETAAWVRAECAGVQNGVFGQFISDYQAQSAQLTEDRIEMKTTAGQVQGKIAEIEPKFIPILGKVREMILAIRCGFLGVTYGALKTKFCGTFLQALVDIVYAITVTAVCTIPVIILGVVNLKRWTHPAGGGGLPNSTLEMQGYKRKNKKGKGDQPPEPVGPPPSGRRAKRTGRSRNQRRDDGLRVKRTRSP